MASIFKTSDGSWRVQVRKRGICDSRNFDRKVDAAAWATMREREINLGSAGLPRRASGTLSELLTRYHQTVYPLKRYGRSKVYELDQLDKDLGALAVGDITTARVVEYGMALRQRMAGQGILNRLCYLREAIRAANDLWDAGAPIAQVDAALAALKRQKVTAKAPARTRRPSDAEIDRIIQFHTGQKCAVVDLPALIAVLRLLPFRIGELLGIEWSDLIPEQRAVKLRARKHPDVTVRETNDYIVPLPTIAGVDTWELIAGRPRFLPRPYPYSRPSVSSAFGYASHRAGIVNLHLHDLRAFSISKLIESGAPIPLIAHLSGHRSWKLMQSVYTRLDPAAVREGIERVAA
jgi:integrase